MTARSLKQEQRDYELGVDSYVKFPPDSYYGLGYAQRLLDELLERGYTTLARRLGEAIEPYRREWLKTEKDPNDD